MIKHRDKLLHFAAGCLVGAVAVYFLPLPVAAIMPAVAGAAKELWDYHGHGTVDVWDFVATAAPGIIIIIA